MRRILCTLAGLVTLCWAAAGWPQGGATVYPERPVRLVVPFPAGGGTDILARALSQQLSEAIGQPVVIENRGGAGGTIGSELVARAAPDGYTLLMGTVGTHAINASLYPNLPYDPLGNFAAVTMIAVVPNLLVVHPSVPARTVADLMALARTKPGRINFGSSGSGTSGHLAAELLRTAARIDIVHVPYKGAGPALTSLVGGEVDMLFSNISVVLPAVRAGRLRALAVASSSRSALVPELPTVAESGLPGFEASSWYGLLAPARTPPAIVMSLYKQVVRVLRSPQVLSRFSGEGAEPVGNTPEEFARQIRADIAKWAKVVRASGARAN